MRASVSFGVLLLCGCAQLPPPSPAPQLDKAGSGVIYRDLTTHWSERHYWTHSKPSVVQSVLSRKSSSTAYLAGKYQQSSKPADFDHQSSLQPGPVTQHDTLPGSTPSSTDRPQAVDASSSVVDLAEGITAASDNPLPRGMSYRIWFAEGRDGLGPQGRERIKRLAANPAFQADLWLRGHTLPDEAIDDPDRFAVGRALSVRQQLAHEGFSHDTRIKYRNGVPGRYVEVTLQ